ncbi:MAG: hypothetical protein M3068_05655 [Gemmatimonadota bacterium]|nr:hypothetical protein [Gemmatimonadota bacterium]
MTFPVRAQRVPGRDLLQLPLGTVDRPAALGGSIGDGLGNPAAIVADSGVRARLSAEALQTPAEQGATARLIGISIALPQRFAAGLSVARASVSNLFRTETDPETIGPDLAYSTSIVSVSVARQHSSHVAVGVAGRYRWGEMDRDRNSAIGIDGGIRATHLMPFDVSLGASTFLWRPANSNDERTTLNLGADMRVAGEEERLEARLGYGAALTEGAEREDFGYAAGHYGVWEARGGLARLNALGSVSWHPRLGVQLHYDQYLVGVAREESGAGLGAIYQFTLSAVLR